MLSTRRLRWLEVDIRVLTDAKRRLQAVWMPFNAELLARLKTEAHATAARIQEATRRRAAAAEERRREGVDRSCARRGNECVGRTTLGEEGGGGRRSRVRKNAAGRRNIHPARCTPCCVHGARAKIATAAAAAASRGARAARGRRRPRARAARARRTVVSDLRGRSGVVAEALLQRRRCADS